LKQKQEISEVKAFTSLGAWFWVNNQRQNGDFFHDDEPEFHLKGYAKTTMRKLGKHVITTGGHIRDMTDKNIQNIVAAEPYLPRARLIQLREQASKCQTGNKPRIIDHQKEANPYESKFGLDWEEPINKSVTLSQYVCITDMVKHIFVDVTPQPRSKQYSNIYLLFLIHNIDRMEPKKYIYRPNITLVLASTSNLLKEERWIYSNNEPNQ
jgi:hypothetical protein